MCGIVGVFSRESDQAVSESDLVAMRDEMTFRGPDDAGVAIFRQEGLFVGFGHRRLSIIDLSPLGRQPMSTADDTLWIVFNGEIYNYRELREELTGTGRYAFKSRTDTEVILYAVKEWGLAEALNRFRGMFAFALFDKIEGSLTLVRDPIGIKPLYYRQDGKTIAFASEIKALLRMPGVGKQVDHTSLYHYLTFANAPAPETFFKGILKLEAGVYLKTYGTGRCEKVRYWDPSRFEPDGEKFGQDYYVSEIRRLLKQSIERRMVSDVPFGAFLSGGVDSSLIVALMSELMDRPVETFSVGIKGDPSNEFQQARSVAGRFGANHHEVVIDDEDFISFLPRMAFHQDEPIGDPICVPLYYVSKLAREFGVLVVQVGEGSDELFAGYDMYRLFKNCDEFAYGPYMKLPQIVRSLAYRASKISGSAVLEDALRRASTGAPLFMGQALAFWDAEKKKLFKDTASRRPSSEFIRELDGALAGDPLRRIASIEMRNRLPELLLTRTDKMSMANSIEVRVPFLDRDLVEFALRIPSGFKIKNRVGKSILKKAAEGIIPHEIIYRRKQGFCGSATNILSPRLTDYARERIMSSRLASQLFNRGYIERLFEKHAKKKRFNSFKIWNLLNLVLWHECWFD
jgi:asparagine synthase (glutamine-hydrolysing)